MTHILAITTLSGKKVVDTYIPAVDEQQNYCVEVDEIFNDKSKNYNKC